MALFRHKQQDISTALMKAHEATEVSRADSLLGQLNRLAADARRIQQIAEAARDYRAALAGVRELTRLVELAARFSGEMTEPQMNGPAEIHIVYEKYRMEFRTTIAVAQASVVSATTVASQFDWAVYSKYSWF